MKWIIGICFILICSSCYTRYISRYYNLDDNTSDFVILKKDSSVLKLYFNGFEWKSNYTKEEYESLKKNASFKINFSINNKPSILINNFDFSANGIIDNDTIKLNNGLIYVEPDDYFIKRDVIPVDSGLHNLSFAKNRCDYCYNLFRIDFQDSLTANMDKYILTIKLNFEIEGVKYNIDKHIKLVRKIEKRDEIGIH